MLLEVSAGEAAGLLSAGLAVAVARTTVVPAGEVLEGAVTVGVPAIRTAISSVPRLCRPPRGQAASVAGMCEAEPRHQPPIPPVGPQ